MNDSEKIRYVLMKSKFDRNEKNRRRFFGGGVWCAFMKLVEAVTSESSDLHNTQAEISVER